MSEEVNRKTEKREVERVLVRLSPATAHNLAILAVQRRTTKSALVEQLIVGAVARAHALEATNSFLDRDNDTVETRARCRQKRVERRRQTISASDETQSATEKATDEYRKNLEGVK